MHEGQLRTGALTSETGSRLAELPQYKSKTKISQRVILFCSTSIVVVIQASRVEHSASPILKGPASPSQGEHFPAFIILCRALHQLPRHQYLRGAKSVHSSFRVRQQFSFATMAAKTDLNTYKFNHSMYASIILRVYRVSFSY